MLRRFKHASFKVTRALSFAVALCVALAGTIVTSTSAWPAYLKLEPKPASEETPLERQKRRFEEFLRYLQKQKQ